LRAPHRHTPPQTNTKKHWTRTKPKQVRGRKALVLDPALSGPLTLLDTRLGELLSEHGVARLLYLERRRLDDPTYAAAEPRLASLRPIVYVARATLENARLIAWQIKNTPRCGAHWA
jgi:hypothetical protein